MSTVRVDNYGDRLGTGSIPAQTLLQGTAKAWLNMNGTGTIATRDSFNVSSIVDNGTGDYTENFSIAMPNANYAAVGSAITPGTSAYIVGLPHASSANQAVANLRFGSYGTSPQTSTDAQFCQIELTGDSV